MSKFWHAAFHIGAVIVQFASVASGVIPPPYGAIVAGVVAAIQGGVAIFNKTKGS